MCFTMCGPGLARARKKHMLSRQRVMEDSVNAGLLTGEAAVLALHRLAQCPREQHSQLRVSAPFTQLLAILEKQAFTLTPKVCICSLIMNFVPQRVSRASSEGHYRSHCCITMASCDLHCFVPILARP